MITPLILAGGQGVRSWPFSRHTYPKPLLPLINDISLLQATFRRLDALKECAPPIVICNRDHAYLIEDQIREAGIDEFSLILEPEGRNTAPAIAVAALWLKRNRSPGSMLVLAADHFIADKQAFASAVRTADVASRDGQLVTFGIKPSGPATGYGYLQIGRELTAKEGVYALEGFIEKPDQKQAQALLDSVDCYWNSGMFMFTPDAII